MTGQASVEKLVAMGAEWFPMPDLSGDVEWGSALDGVDAVVHLAAIAHRGKADDDATLYDQVNHLATKQLALAISQRPTIRRFVFISSVRVHGDPTVMPVVESSPLAPTTPYDFSKVNAEQAIGQILAQSSTEWAILRPVLVYGPGNRGNMAKLEGLLRAGVPVPIGRVSNRRSFIFIGNFISAIEAYLSKAQAPSGRTWIIADESPSSTESLVSAMARAMGIKVRVVHLPSIVLSWAGLFGDLCQNIGISLPWTSEIRQKLLGDFYVDISPVMMELEWRPPYTQEEGLNLTYRVH
jgi:nucleoside-diphosphate-sugar epimerase